MHLLIIFFVIFFYLLEPKKHIFKNSNNIYLLIKYKEKIANQNIRRLWESTLFAISLYLLLAFGLIVWSNLCNPIIAKTDSRIIFEMVELNKFKYENKEYFIAENTDENYYAYQENNELLLLPKDNTEIKESDITKIIITKQENKTNPEYKNIFIEYMANYSFLKNYKNFKLSQVKKSKSSKILKYTIYTSEDIPVISLNKK